MSIKTGTTLYIHKLRIISNERDTHALQLRHANRLSAMSLHPANLSPHAILCIRTVHDPRQQQQKSIPSAKAWEQAVSANIKRELEHAAHPAQEEVGENATAVLFADHAELLACLASDWQQGKLTQHWWWRNLLGRSDVYNAFISAWLETPEHIPAALQHLATRRQAIPFIRQLPPTIISALLAGILRSFALYTLQTVFSRQARDDQPPIVEEKQDWGGRREMNHPLYPASMLGDAERHQEINRSPYPTGNIDDAEINFLDSTGQAAFPHEITEEGQNQTLKNASQHELHWQEWLPDSAETGLSIEQRMLLTISLMLVRTPTIVRSTAFAHSVHQWLQENTQEQAPIASREPLKTHLISRNDTSIPKPHMQPQNALIENSQKQEDTKTTHLSIDNPAIGSSDVQEQKNLQGASLIFVENTDGKENIEIPNQDITDLTQLNYRIAKPGKRVSARQTDQPIASIGADKSRPLQDSSIGTFCATSGITGKTAGDEPPVLPHREHPTYLKRGNHAARVVTREAAAGDEPPALPRREHPVYLESDHHVWQSSTRQIPENGLETAFGGLFYLINVGIYLELYGDFTTPAQPGIPLTIWDFLSLLGFRLLGATIQDDPIWPLLSLLAGRTEHKPPGSYFEPLADWRLPTLWLKPFLNENSWQWTETQGRLYMYHPAGFLILDIPLLDNREEQLKLEMQAYVECGDVTLMEREGHLSPFITIADGTNDPPGTSSQVVRWLDRLTPYLSARLQHALGTNDDPIPTVCMQKAHIAISTTHLDVYLSLATLPIEVRIAGLDRNPGWVPAAGCYVTFYFE